MHSFELIPFPSGETLAIAVAERWLEAIQSASRNEAPYCVALSGGRIARKFCAEVAGRAQARAVSFGHVHFFWADERCVPPTDTESNFAIARDLLLVSLQVPPDRVHRIRGEIAPERAASEAEAEICRIAPLNGSGQPVLDLVILGMGEDGHVASLFPGAQPEVVDSKEVYLAVVATKPPPERISINYSTIAAAREAWVLASGAGKGEALRESLTPGGRTPLAQVIRMRPKTVIFSDIGVGA